MEERFQKRLTMWTVRYIFKGGRITLIWSTLASSSIYYMSVLYLHRMIILRLEQIQRISCGKVGLLRRKLI